MKERRKEIEWMPNHPKNNCPEWAKTEKRNDRPISIFDMLRPGYEFKGEKVISRADIVLNEDNIIMLITYCTSFEGFNAYKIVGNNEPICLGSGECKHKLFKKLYSHITSKELY